MTIRPIATDIAERVEAFVREVVIPYEKDERRDHHGAPLDELVYEMRDKARSASAKREREKSAQDYFEEQAYLTQSGQLYIEATAMALGKVYSFGPTFRAEKSKTRRHLTEFWMVEPEVSYANLDDVMDLAEDFLCHIATRVLEKLVALAISILITIAVCLFFASLVAWGFGRVGRSLIADAGRYQALGFTSLGMPGPGG